MPLIQKDKEKKKPLPAVESLVSGRAPRVTAGNRLGQLLTEETEDDFYKTALGGFGEESGDEEYETEEDVGDVVDSDFDRDEDEENYDPGSDFEEPAKKRTKATYKDPRAKKQIEPARKRIQTPKKQTVHASVSNAAVSSATQAEIVPDKVVKESVQDGSDPSAGTRKSHRLSTVEQRREHQKRQMESLNKPKKAVKVIQYRTLSQEELLAEAVETERENLASLAAYRRLEEERKKSKTPKSKFTGPTIRFLSSTVFVSTNCTVDKSDTADGEITRGERAEKYCRNFLSFSKKDDCLLTHKASLKKPEPAVCPVTGLPAKYRDPVTGTAYASAEAFHMIRTCYARTQHRQQQKGQERT